MKAIIAVLALGGVLLASNAAAQDPPPWERIKAQGAQALLAHVDKRHNDHPSFKWIIVMTLKDRNGNTRSYKMSTWQKGRYRLIRFLEPGEVKGMSVLVRGEKMYVYSPQTDNVRRVAAHARKQTFMGSDLTYDDMGQVNFGADYDAAFDKETATHQWLSLTRKADSKMQFKKLRLRIPKVLQLIDFIEYYDGGAKVKTQERFQPNKSGGATVETYRKIVVTDLQSGHKTEMFVESQRVGDNIPNKAFKKRNLVRGN
jgi:outer membrane lipoprotein-sorting protein